METLTTQTEQTIREMKRFNWRVLQVNVFMNELYKERTNLFLSIILGLIAGTLIAVGCILDKSY